MTDVPLENQGAELKGCYGPGPLSACKYLLVPVPFKEQNAGFRDRGLSPWGRFNVLLAFTLSTLHSL